MALTVEVVKPLGEGRVQVDTKRKWLGSEIVQHYSVPEEKADAFIADYKKEVPKMQRNGGIIGAVAGIVSMALGVAAAKKAGPILKTLSMALFTVAGVLGTAFAVGTNNAKKARTMLDKHDAKPIFYLKGQEKVSKAEEKETKPAEEASPEETKKD